MDGGAALARELAARFPFLDAGWAGRLVRGYGTEAAAMLGGARTAADLGERFGWDLTEREVRWLMAREWAVTAEDVLWRRTKLGLRLTRGGGGAAGRVHGGGAGAGADTRESPVIPLKSLRVYAGLARLRAASLHSRAGASGGSISAKKMEAGRASCNAAIREHRVRPYPSEEKPQSRGSVNSTELPAGSRR